MSTHRNRFVRLPEDQQERLRDELATRGEDALSDHFDISRLSLMRAACGLDVLRGTRKAIAAGLADLEDDGVVDEDEEEDDDEDGEDEDDDR